MLAAMYSEVRRFPQAVEAAGRALALALQQNDQNRATALRARIAAYRSMIPGR